MREIKARCWYGNKFIYNPYAFGYDDIGPFFCEDQTADWLYCNDIQQYTGLKDKAGNEIYEDDIIQDIKFEDLIAVVSFENGCFVGTYNDYGSEILNAFDTYIVIGNIYENPELTAI